MAGVIVASAFRIYSEVLEGTYSYPNTYYAIIMLIKVESGGVCNEKDESFSDVTVSCFIVVM